METLSKPLRFVVGQNLPLMEVSKSALTTKLNEPISQDDWDFFEKVCKEVFVYQNNVFDIVEEISFQEEELLQRNFVAMETLRFVGNVYLDTVSVLA